MKSLIFGVLLLGLLATNITAAPTNLVTVAWDQNPETNIVDYQTYYGVIGTTETNVLSAGTNLSQPITNLTYGAEYWFYVTAKNTHGLESD